jgi:CDP-glycerol glycerophosphotransferase (TagB/SpsB family)
MKIIFDTLNSYYLPQYLPIYHELYKRGHDLSFVSYRNKDQENKVQRLFNDLSLNNIWVNGEEEAEDYYLKVKADWVFFGNGISYIDSLSTVSRTAQLGHGIGPKPSYYRKSNTPMTVRFIEGELRLDVIKKMYPNDKFIQVGYSKLDPLIRGEEPGLNLQKLGLDPSKKTILYAPTFNPSSLERFPDNWPSHFPDYNILVKAHGFTYSRERYSAQRTKLAAWSKFENVYVATIDDVSLLPFMKDADLLLSEASSTLFEFVALDKPVLVCDFYKLKWSYRGPFKYRFEKRFGQDNVIYKDIGAHAYSYPELRKLLEQQLDNPGQYKEQRRLYTRDHVGNVDGKASQRIADYLEANS